MITVAITLPSRVTGYTSPYPTVVTITTAHQNASPSVVIFEHGALYSTTYTLNAPAVTVVNDSSITYTNLLLISSNIIIVLDIKCKYLKICTNLKPPQSCTKSCVCF